MWRFVCMNIRPMSVRNIKKGIGPRRCRAIPFPKIFPCRLQRGRIARRERLPPYPLLGSRCEDRLYGARLGIVLQQQLRDPPENLGRDPYVRRRARLLRVSGLWIRVMSEPVFGLVGIKIVSPVNIRPAIQFMSLFCV